MHWMAGSRGGCRLSATGPPPVMRSVGHSAMRTLLAIACLALCGCDFMSSRGPGPTTEISDASGNHRLMMRYVAVNRGYDFDALIWRTNAAGEWKQRLIITQDDFERGSQRARWVSEIHSFDPATGLAIIKVAE